MTADMTTDFLDPKLHIAFIGAGNMASALAGGLIANSFPAGNILLSDINEAQLQSVKDDLGVEITSDNTSAVAKANIVVLAVKPQIMQQVLEPLKGKVPDDTVVISIAAGVTLGQLENWLGESTAVVRCMPNTPALLNSGMTGLFANENVTTEQSQRAEGLLKAAGKTCWMNSEPELDAVTAVSGSGPAYFFLVAEAMIEAGKKLGLSEEVATELTVQTAFGASRMLQESDVKADILRQRVTSPGGTTEAAINVLQKEGIMDTFEKALLAARDRSEELSKN